MTAALILGCVFFASIIVLSIRALIRGIPDDDERDLAPEAEASRAITKLELNNSTHMIGE
jgi:hypothetical protein